MPLDREADYVFYLYTCNRCRSCAVDQSPDLRPLCPAYAHFGYFTYSGGGKGYVAQGLLEGKVKPSQEVAVPAMSCLLCGACAHMCPPGFDTMSFVRDLRDYLVCRGFYINDRHRELLDDARSGRLWGKAVAMDKLPVYTGEEEFLVFLGCREKSRGEVVAPVKRILDAAGVTWGVLEEEPCCGAPLEDLGDIAAFEELAAKNIELLNASGAERILALCPHCAATMANDYMNVDDLEAEIVTLPRLLDELLEENRIDFSTGEQMAVTYHDPCRLGRFLEEVDEPRRVLDAMGGVELVEMERSGESAWCCGSGAWAAEIVPELGKFTVKERLAEARSTGADCILTACSYCTGFLKKSSRGKQKVIHLAEFAAQKIKP